MKTSAFLRIIIWTVIAALLIAILVALVIERPPWFSLSGAWGGSYQDSELYTPGSGSVQAQEINEIEVNWVSGHVSVSAYDGNEITFSESASRQLNSNEQMQYYVKNGRLIIQFQKSKRFCGWFNKGTDKSIDIKIPADTTLKNFRIESVSASVTADGITSESVSMENVSGATKLSNLFCTRFDAEAVSGSMDVAGAVDTTEVESVSGSITIAPGGMARSVNAETVSGAINVILPENDGFTARYSSVSGGFRCDFPAVSASNNTVTYKEGIMRIDMESVSGGMAVTQK